MARPFGPPLQIRGSPDRDLHLTRRRGVDGQPVRSADITFEPRYMTEAVYGTLIIYEKRTAKLMTTDRSAGVRGRETTTSAAAISKHYGKNDGGNRKRCERSERLKRTRRTSSRARIFTATTPNYNLLALAEILHTHASGAFFSLQEYRFV
ncbi:hypothetical protein QTP88_017750 [Uroleucon formosanum]